MEIKIEGIEKVLKAFKSYPDKIRRQVDAEFKDAANRISGIAQRKVPKDQGALQRSITVKGSNADYQVIVQNPIGIVQEFGTGKFAGTQTPSEFQPYAMSFQGIKIPSSGTLQENILGWVKRKNIGQGRKGPALTRRKKRGQKEKEQATVAFLIARKIAKEGIKPHPFLLATFKEEKEILIQRLIKLLGGK